MDDWSEVLCNIYEVLTACISSLLWVQLAVWKHLANTENFLNFLLSNRLFGTLRLQTLKYFSESGLTLYFYLSWFKIQRRVVQRPSLTSFFAFLHRTLYQNGAICQKHTACDSVLRICRPWGPVSLDWDCRLRQTISRDPSRCENCFHFFIDIMFYSILIYSSFLQ